MEQQKLSVKQEMLQLRVEVRRSKRAFESARELYAEKLISKEEWLKAEEDYMLAKDRLDLVETRAQQDSLYRAVEIDQMTESLNNMRLNMRMIRKRKESYHKGTNRWRAWFAGCGSWSEHCCRYKGGTDK
jgi:HlyD family secretion protein